MGLKKRKFVKPIYEISIESQNKVYIKEEDKGLLRILGNGIFKFVVLPILMLVFITLFIQIAQNIFSPPELLIAVQHITSGKSISPAELAQINIYIDDSSRPAAKKVRHNGLSIRFRKKGLHVLGIENLASPVDSALFHREKSYIKNIRLSKSLRTGKALDEKLHFSFHKVISSKEFEKTKILYYTISEPESPKPHLFFSAYANAPQLLLFYPTAYEKLKSDISLDDFAGHTLSKLAPFSRRTGILAPEELQKLDQEYHLSAPGFNAFCWYSDLFKHDRYAFAHDLMTTARATLLLLPNLSQKNSGVSADFVLAFAALGGVHFQPILVRDCNADWQNDQFLTITDKVSLMDIIEKYLLIYEDFIASGVVHDNIVQQFVDFCSSLAPQVDALIYFDNQVIRSADGAPKKAAELDLEDFLSEIEPLTCMPLYERLMTFWTKDAEAIGQNELTLRNREIMRALFRRSLALKAEKHMCSEQNWPSVSQQLLLFQAMQDKIGKRWTWEWLASEPWLDMVKSEIDSLNDK